MTKTERDVISYELARRSLGPKAVHDEAADIILSALERKGFVVVDKETYDEMERLRAENGELFKANQNLVAAINEIVN